MLRSSAVRARAAARPAGGFGGVGVLLALAAASAGPTAAGAADLPARYRAPAYYDPPAPIFTWTGFYVGAQAGLGLGSYTAGGPRVFGSNPLGGLGGITGGYNYQSGQLLIGGEVDAGFGYIGSNGSFGGGATGTGSINGLGTARARVGYVYDRALFYVTGGYAGTVLNGKVSDFANAPNLVVNQSHYLSGFSVGLGMEYAITTRISVKGEYLFNGFNSAPYFSGTRDAIPSGANISLLRAGVNYHF